MTQKVYNAQNGVYTVQNGVLSTGPRLIEGGENGLAAWSGSTGQFTTVTSPVYTGTHSIRGNDDGSYASAITSRPGDGLSHYLGAGDEFSVALRGDGSGSWPTFMWCCASESNLNGPETGYQVRATADNHDCEILYYSNAAETETSIALVQNSSIGSAEYLIPHIVHHGGGTFDLSVYDETGTFLGSDSGSDTHRSSGSMKFRRRRGGTQYFDDLRLLSTNN